jgi:hypothetical protein
MAAGGLLGRSVGGSRLGITMRRRYRQQLKLSAVRKQRLMRVLATPLFFRVGLPSLLAAYALIGITLTVTPLVWRGIDTNAWPFIVPTVAVGFMACFGTFLILHPLFIRWLLRYRSRRRGRLVALGDVLRASDANPTRWRLLVLRAYGISDAERRLFLE